MLERKEKLSSNYLPYLAQLKNHLKIKEFQPFFYDIETTGLSAMDSYLYLIGMMYIENDCLYLHQLFAETIEEEILLLQKFFTLVNSRPFHLLQYNGNRFDQPFLTQKYEQYLLNNPFDSHLSTDLYLLYKPYRNTFHFRNMAQHIIELKLGMSSRIYPDGLECISYYQRIVALTGLKLKYQIDHSEEYQQYLDLLLGHNREDLKGLLQICKLSFYFGWKTAELSSCAISNIRSDDNILIIEGSFQSLVFPLSLELQHREITLSFQSNKITLQCSIVDNKVPLYHKNITDYVYLPQEDYVIPKTLASFMEKSLYTKATSENCYTWFPIHSEFLNDTDQQKQLLSHYLLYFFEQN